MILNMQGSWEVETLVDRIGGDDTKVMVIKEGGAKLATSGSIIHWQNKTQIHTLS